MGIEEALAMESPRGIGQMVIEGVFGRRDVRCKLAMGLEGGGVVVADSDDDGVPAHESVLGGCRLPQARVGQSIEVTEDAVGSLVQEREGTRFEEFAVAPGECSTVAKILRGVLGLERLDP